ncbi:hypothetical protein SAMN04488563_5046 [Jiangella alkaliphila]|uniref:UPF0235 protein SAMN04488563_5046 n=1 Tax=Jiangella alkaliphila TaxID=419479 RepID=A0A1H2L453_9ACTN|nr:hypothetical protein SAMN04488563_5046 [Jiangella alkaliphila]
MYAGRRSRERSILGPVRVTIRVRPGASRTAVGGRYADALVVAVQARAVDGAATKAALDALADALGIRRREVTLLTGTTSRTKTVEVPDAAASRLADLMREAD